LRRQPSGPHHLRFVQPRALGRKVSDEYAMPLCRTHHREVHRQGDEAAWWAPTGIDALAVAHRLWQHKGAAQHLYEDGYCQRGQMENLIKLHKAQLASDRMSCHIATANQVRLVLDAAAFWLTGPTVSIVSRPVAYAPHPLAGLQPRNRWWK
jgi:hypothetical protein